MRDYKKLLIWQKGMEISIETYLLSKSLPDSEKFGLTSQITRAAVSIPSNIAEGCSRSSEKDYLRFLEISLGSTYELETQLNIVIDLKLTDKIKLQKLSDLVVEEQKMITVLINKIKKTLVFGLDSLS